MMHLPQTYGKAIMNDCQSAQKKGIKNAHNLAPSMGSTEAECDCGSSNCIQIWHVGKGSANCWGAGNPSLSLSIELR